MRLFAVDQHDQLLQIWRQIGLQSARVLHVDFHCDMRGLLVDCEGQRCWRIREVRNSLDEGNFLRYAILEGMVGGVTWVHGTPGGRRFDVHSVKYTTDWSSRFHRRVTRESPGTPLEYQVVEMNDWQGCPDGCFLDIDWDTFADHSLPASEIDRRVEQFLQKPMGSNLVGAAVCYSPHHSHDSRQKYEEFVAVLAERLGTTAEYVEYVEGSNQLPMRKKLMPEWLYSQLQGGYHAFLLTLKRLGLE